MEKQLIDGYNCIPGAPPNWEASKFGECGALPIRIFPPAAIANPGIVDVQYCESAWLPTAQELEWLNKGGQLILRVHSWQVPVALYVNPPKPVEDNNNGQ
jgi:hypothetical protein